MVSKKTISSLVAMTFFILLLSGCAKATPTEDPSIKITEIASTVQAELTQIAALTPSITPTLTPTVTATPAPATPTLSTTTMPTATNTIQPGVTGSSADDAKWIADVTIPDGTIVSASSSFVKTWTIENTGQSTWTKEFQLIYLEGVQGTNHTLAVKLTKAVAPGEQVDISVPFTAPATNGAFTSYWKMYSASGYVFGELQSLVFTVGIVPTATP